MKKCILVAFLCAMAYAQFLDDKFVVLPKFELKSQMTAKVKHFVENAKQQQGFVRKTNVKRDLLGRKTEDSTSYLVDYAKEERMKVVVSYINQPSPFSGKLYGRYESGFSADEKKYWLNGIEMDEMSYLSKHDEIRKSIRRSIPQYRQPYVAFLTAKEIQQLLAGPEFVYVSEYMDRIPLSNDTTVNGRVYYRDSIIRVLSQIQTGAFQNGYKGNGIGIYFSEAGCPNLNYVNASYYVQVDSCFRGVRTHPTRVTRVLQTTAPQATVYGFEEGTSRPANPLNYPIPIYIGSHSWGIPPSSADSVSSYTYEDIAMDNYVYNDRVILFIAAGNKMSSTDTYYISSPGKSVNSITVGAVEPNTYNYAAYSCWKNSELQNHKPEIPNFAHFYFMGDTPFSVMEDGVLKTYNGVFSGTSASTPYTAAMAADVLSQHSFFKTHPEMFKALMMTGSTVPVADANSKDLDNYIRIKKIPQYNMMGWNTRSAYWNGNNSDFFESDSSINFTESGIVQGGRYRIAISWLSYGDYVGLNKLLPQDMDLYIYQNGSLIASSISSINPFELVDFTAPTSGNLTIRIKRYRNSQSDNVLLGYNFLNY